MYLITSAAFVNSDLASEFGEIPPSFLPLENRPLFMHQIDLIGDEKIFISLPETYSLSEFEISFFEEKNIKTIDIPIGLTLGESVFETISKIKNFEDSLKILHGDTLFKRLPRQNDIFLVGQPSDNYNWDSSSDEEVKYVYTGFFSFSDQNLFSSILEDSNKNFIDGIKKYAKIKNVTLKPSDTWLDFGHINTYYRAKSIFTTERAFNNLDINRFYVKKSGDNDKISAEYSWYEKIPLSLQKYTPKLWTFGQDGKQFYYIIDYMYLSTLSDLFVHGNNKDFVWTSIMKSCHQFIEDCYKVTNTDFSKDNKNSQKLYTHKTRDRLNSMSKTKKINLDQEWKINGMLLPSLNNIIEELDDHINSSEYIPQNTVIHGDFCFSNILYDFKSKSIKVIDPRGIDYLGNKTIFGDVRYDISKLAHSIIGCYDHIVAGKYLLKEFASNEAEFKIYTCPNVSKIQNHFNKMTFLGHSIEDLSIYPIMINLFLSMLPLHYDNKKRQKAFLYNALRLYSDFKGLKKI